MGHNDDTASVTTQKSWVPEQNAWRFTYEALTHVHSLRLFLFNNVVPVPWRCVSLQASPQSESPLSSSPVVLCQWVSPDGFSHKLLVPIPVCLVDYSVPFAASVRRDHFEIKLSLLSSGGSFVDDLSLLGFTYRGEPVDRNGGEVGESAAFSLNCDTELLSSANGVKFYCRTCSVEVVNRPISCFRALPSTEWRELADHWFGVCCCRDGVHTSSLMARFDELMTPTTGVCLVGSTTCVLHRDDLVRKTAGNYKHASEDDEAQCTQVSENNDEIYSGDGLDPGIGGMENHLDLPSGTSKKLSGHDSRTLESPTMTVNVNFDKVLEDLTTCCSRSPARHGDVDCSIDKFQGSAAAETNGMEEPVDPKSCCTGSAVGHGNGVPDKLAEHAGKTKSIANGFMSSVPISELTAFNCYSCAGLIGVCPRGTEENVQFFKCHISSDLPTNGPSDIFRFHTLERVFSNELLTNAEEDSSYRYTVRDQSSRLPLLQLVIINHDSWNCSGFCAEEQRRVSEPEQPSSAAGEQDSMVTAKENEAISATLPFQDSHSITNSRNKKLSRVFLQPIMKLMFRNTSSSSSEELVEVESWGQRNQSDDLYMLDSEVKSLARSLQANRMLFPESSAAFQQFHISFLAR